MADLVFLVRQPFRKSSVQVPLYILITYNFAKLQKLRLSCFTFNGHSCCFELSNTFFEIKLIKRLRICQTFVIGAKRRDLFCRPFTRGYFMRALEKGVRISCV